MTITIIGKNSFLGRALADHAAAKHWLFLGHDEALQREDWLDKTQCVFNLALHPDMKSADYDEGCDIDLHLGRKIAAQDIHYVMASTRMVYGFAPDDLYLREDMPPQPENTYGRNKWQTEQALAALMPAERLTILRMGNIFGFEPGRRTFFGMALTKLQEEGVMSFDIAPDSLRDFLPTTFWAGMVSIILENPQPGIFNIGSGFGITVDEIASWLMEAYGGGKAEYTAFSYDGQFIMDMRKTAACYRYEPVSKALLKIFVQALARRLKQVA